MNGRQVLALLVVVAVVAGVGLAVHLRRERVWRMSAQEAGARLLPKLDVNAVEAIRITDGSGTVELHRQDGVWSVAQREDYAADFAAIQRLLVDVSELKVVREVVVGEAQYARLGLLPPGTKDKGGTLLSLWGANGLEAGRLLVGKEYTPAGADAEPWGRGFAAGRYVLVPSRGEVALVSNAFASLVSSPATWLDKEFIRITELKTARLVENGNTVWELKREKATDDLTLVGLGPDEELDAAKTGAVASAFAWAGFADIAGRLKNAADWGLDTPRIFEASDFDGFEYAVGIGALKDGRYAATVAVAFKGPDERVPDKGETPEDRAKKAAVFKAQLAERQAKATALKRKTEGWVFLLEQPRVEKVLIPRNVLLKNTLATAAKAVTPTAAEEGGDRDRVEGTVEAK